MGNALRHQRKIMLKALFIHDGDGKTLAEVKRVARNEAVKIWYGVERSLLRVRQVTYFEDLRGWVAVVQRLG